MREEGEGEGEREAHFFPLGKRGPENASQAPREHRGQVQPVAVAVILTCASVGRADSSVRPSSASMGRRGSVAAARLIVARRPRRYQRENLRSLGRSVCGATFTAAAAAAIVA